MDGLRIVGKGARLAGLGTRNLHYYMQDRVYHSRTMLKWRGTPEAVLLRENPDYNNLTLAQQAGVERYLLTRKTVDEAPYPVGSAPYNVLNTAHTAYSVLTRKQKTRVDAYLLRKRHVSAATHIIGSPEYEAQDRVSKAAVLRFLPISRQYRDLNPDARAIVDQRNATKDEIHRFMVPIRRRFIVRLADRPAELAFHGTKKLHYYMQDTYYNSYDKLIGSGIPSQALLHREPQYQALPVDQQAQVEAYLLSRKRPNEADPVAFPVNSNVRNMLEVAHYAYNLLTREQKTRVDAYLLSRSGIPAAAFVSGSIEYNELDPVQKARVARYWPGSKEYNALNPDARAIVNERNGTEDAIKSRRLHYQTIDPDKRYKYLPSLSVVQTVREAILRSKAAMDNFQNHMSEIKRIPPPGDADPYYWLREWLIGAPTPANPNPTVDNPNNAETVRQVVFSLETVFMDWAMGTQHTTQKMYRSYQLCTRNLRKHRWHLLFWGKSKSAYKDVAGQSLAKLLSGSGFWNEPVTGRAPQSLTFYAAEAAR